MHNVYIALGSNLGNRAANIERAVELLEAHDRVKVVVRSSVYEMDALTRDLRPQPAYVNGVVAIATTLAPFDLLNLTQSIEIELGRPADHGDWQPRVIDLDILLYGDLVMSTPLLTIPHPEMTKRIFVLKPLCDIAADAMHPVFKKSFTTLLNELVC